MKNKQEDQEENDFIRGSRVNENIMLHVRICTGRNLFIVSAKIYLFLVECYLFI